MNSTHQADIVLKIRIEFDDLTPGSFTYHTNNCMYIYKQIQYSESARNVDIIFFNFAQIFQLLVEYETSSCLRKDKGLFTKSEYLDYHPIWTIFFLNASNFQKLSAGHHY
jgi:hypothetical protein